VAAANWTMDLHDDLPISTASNEWDSESSKQ
jgi:hypothetical protein